MGAGQFYLVCENKKQRTALIEHLKKNDILAVFHYLSLHKSEYYKDKYEGQHLPFADFYSDCLVRLPIYNGLLRDEIAKIINKILDY